MKISQEGNTNNNILGGSRGLFARHDGVKVELWCYWGCTYKNIRCTWKNVMCTYKNINCTYKNIRYTYKNIRLFFYFYPDVKI